MMGWAHLLDEGLCAFVLKERHAPPQTYENIIISKNGASLAHALRNIARGGPGNKMALDVPIIIIGQTT